MKNFWVNLPKPFTALAPMEGVTDVVFREIISDIGKPDVLFTEFVNVEGLNSSGFQKVSEGLLFTRKQKPVVAQIWGTRPEDFEKSAKMCLEMGFSGIDINMGCPVRDVVKIGACSALINNKKLAKEIIDSVKRGSGSLPVSVKTRIGFSDIQIDEWIGFLLEQNLDALTVHLRTVSEMSKVPAHWDLMPHIIEIKNKISPKTIIIGNGDIKSIEEVRLKFDSCHADGYMIGRGIFENPFMFSDKDIISTDEKIDIFLAHIELFEKQWKYEKNPSNLKKFCKTYLNNFEGAGELRNKIMDAKTTFEMKTILGNYK